MTEALARVNVLAIENRLRQLPQVGMPTDHFVSDGMYCRRLLMKARVATVGRVHKLEHFFVVALGEILVSGDENRRFISGSVIISPPGTKRAVVAIQPSALLTFHRISDMPNWKTATLEEIEDYISEIDPESMYGVGNTLKVLT